MSRNEELGLELLNMVNAKATIMRHYGKRDIGLEAEQEVQRVKAIVSRLSSRKLQVRKNYLKEIFKNPIKVLNNFLRIVDFYKGIDERCENFVNVKQSHL